MFGVLALVGLGLTAFLVTKGKGAQNLTFGMSFKNFGIDKIDTGGITFNVLIAVDNASNQTYTIADGKFTLRYPNDAYSKAGDASFKGTTTILPRSNNEISVKINVGILPAIKILLEYVRVKRAKGYIMNAGLVGTVSVLDMPSINIKQDLNLFEYLDTVPQMVNSFLNIFGKAKPNTTQGTDNGRNTEQPANTPNSLIKPNGTPTTTQKQLVAQGKARSKWFVKKPKV